MCKDAKKKRENKIMREKSNNWIRIAEVIKWANMSTNSFALHIGLPRGENLYQIKRGNNGISIDLAERIVAKYPQIDKLWLLTGDGTMFAGERPGCTQIPFYDMDPEPAICDIGAVEAACSFIIPPLGDCDMAMRYTGRAMGAATPPGTIVMLKKIGVDAIIPGHEYVIVSQKIVTLRNIRTMEDDTQLRLVAVDGDHYDDIVVKKCEIKEVYRVKGKLTINA